MFRKSRARVHQPQLSLESLESRQMMAGDIQAYMSGGDLYIVEAANQVGQASNVRVSQILGGKIHVQGLEAPGAAVASKVNGQAFQDFLVPGNLFVKLGGGDDIVQLGNDDGSGAPSFRNVQIDTSRPASSVPGTKGPANGTLLPQPADNDNVIVWTAKVADSMTVITGDGHDSIFMGGATIGDGSGTDLLTIRTGNGPDGVKLKATIVRGNVDIQTSGALAEGDVDNVLFDAGAAGSTKIEGSLNVRTGGGGDLFLVGQPTYAGGFVALSVDDSLIVDMGGGNDLLEINNAKIGKATGNGADKDLLIRMGAGADTAKLRNVRIEEYFDMAMYEAAEADVDVAVLDHVFGFNGDMSIRTGAGNDAVSLTNVTVHRILYVETGADDDKLALYEAVTALGSANLSGGAGLDVLNFYCDNAFSLLNRYDWELVTGLPTQRDVAASVRR